MRDFMRVALERDPRSLAFLDEVRSRRHGRPPRPRPPDRRPAVTAQAPEDPHGLRHRQRRRRPRARAPRDRHDRLADDGHARRPAADLPDLVPVGRRRDAGVQRPAGEAQRATSPPTRGWRCTSTTTDAATTSSSSRARRGSTSPTPPVRPRTPPTSRSTASWIREHAELAPRRWRPSTTSRSGSGRPAAGRSARERPGAGSRSSAGAAVVGRAGGRRPGARRA